MLPRLSQQISRRDSVVDHQNLFEYEKDGELDPFASNFNARKYVRSLAKLGQGSERLSGIAYKDLTVTGIASDAGELTS